MVILFKRFLLLEVYLFAIVWPVILTSHHWFQEGSLSRAKLESLAISFKWFLLLEVYFFAIVRPVFFKEGSLFGGRFESLVFFPDHVDVRFLEAVLSAAHGTPHVFHHPRTSRRRLRVAQFGVVVYFTKLLFVFHTPILEPRLHLKGNKDTVITISVNNNS